MTPADMVAAYVKLRDFKKAATDEFNEGLKRTNQAMEKLEGMMLEHLQTTGGDSLACSAGTVYRTTQYSASVADKEAFRDWVKERDGWDALDIKANKTTIRELFDAGVEVPGVKLTSIYTIGVRRK